MTRNWGVPLYHEISNLLHGAETFVLVEEFGASWKPKGVLQYSEEPMTESYHETFKLISHLHSPLHSTLILSHFHRGLPSDLLP